MARARGEVTQRGRRVVADHDGAGGRDGLRELLRRRLLHEQLEVLGRDVVGDLGGLGERLHLERKPAVFQHAAGLVGAGNAFELAADFGGHRVENEVEAARVLLHLVDGTEENIAEAYRTVRRELKAYGGGLDKKKEIVALTKCDALDEATIAERSEALKKVARKKPLVISAVAGIGMREALFALAREIGRADDKEREEAEADEPKKPWSP